ncbi:MAG: phenylacetate-CoA oxygenase subunit PaaI [Bacteroidetes bacterium]|nr:MAG: phenylacetate-CoA oxygenase subunit PaaI [Bacteroidota bacterium]
MNSTGKTFLTDYLLHLADDALILGHRNSEWCGHGPILEQDIALTNISLDLIGQARSLYQYAANILNESHPARNVSEDTLAYLRDNREFKNCLLVEMPNGDWAHTILRQFFFSTYQFFLYEKLVGSVNDTIAAISAKAIKEVTYHLRWSGEWVIRLGDGTDESKERLLKAFDMLWPFTGELFHMVEYEIVAADLGIGADLNLLRSKWDEKLKIVFQEAGILSIIENKIKPGSNWMQSGGKIGKHSEHLGFILAELQFMQRAYPNSEW